MDKWTNSKVHNLLSPFAILMPYIISAFLLVVWMSIMINFLCWRKASLHSTLKTFLHCRLFGVGCGDVQPSHVLYMPSSCMHKKMFTEEAANEWEICSFTHQLQFMFINEVRTRPVTNPNILNWMNWNGHIIAFKFCSRYF